jgi:hypothetical protein
VRQAAAVLELAVIFRHLVGRRLSCLEVPRLVHEHFSDQPLNRGNEIAQPHRFHQRFMA